MECIRLGMKDFNGTSSHPEMRKLSPICDYKSSIT